MDWIVFSFVGLSAELLKAWIIPNLKEAKDKWLWKVNVLFSMEKSPNFTIRITIISRLSLLFFVASANIKKMNVGIAILLYLQQSRGLDESTKWFVYRLVKSSNNNAFNKLAIHTSNVMSLHSRWHSGSVEPRPLLLFKLKIVRLLCTHASYDLNKFSQVAKNIIIFDCCLTTYKWKWKEKCSRKNDEFSFSFFYSFDDIIEFSIVCIFEGGSEVLILSIWLSWNVRNYWFFLFIWILNKYFPFSFATQISTTDIRAEFIPYHFKLKLSATFYEVNFSKNVQIDINFWHSVKWWEYRVGDTKQTFMFAFSVSSLPTCLLIGLEFHTHSQITYADTSNGIYSRINI